MFVNHTKKYIFVRPPKTAGSSIQNHLIENSLNDEISTTQMDSEYVQDFYEKYPEKKNSVIQISFAHMTIDDPNALLLFKDHDITQYKIYSVVRHPVDRFMSAIFFMMAQKQLPTVSNNDYLARTVLSYDFKKWLHFLPQTTWLLHNEKQIDKIYAFENINQLALDLTGVELNKRHKTNQRAGRDNTLSKKLEEEIISIYQRDHDLYNEIRNKQ